MILTAKLVMVCAIAVCSTEKPSSFRVGQIKAVCFCDNYGFHLPAVDGIAQKTIILMFTAATKNDPNR